MFLSETINPDRSDNSSRSRSIAGRVSFPTINTFYFKETKVSYVMLCVAISDPMGRDDPRARSAPNRLMDTRGSLR